MPAHQSRFYDKQGLLPGIRRNDHGNSIFEKRALDLICLMICFRAGGMSVADLKKSVELALQGDETIGQRCAMLETHHQEIKRKYIDKPDSPI